MEIQKLIEDAVWREYGQTLDDLRRQSDGGVTANYMVKVVKVVTESALKECMKIFENEAMERRADIEDLEKENDNLRAENKDLHFKNDVIENICLQHQELTQWIEEEIDNEPDTRIFEVSHDFLENLYERVHKLNHEPY
jgi:hypothetical protein